MIARILLGFFAAVCLIILVLFLMFLVTISTVPQECTKIAQAEKYMDQVKTNVLKSYTEEYLQSDYWLAFEESFWNSFEEQHQYCKICYMQP